MKLITALAASQYVLDSGDAALITFEEPQPDVVILDWMLPGVSGIEICRRIKSSPKSRGVPIIMLTARGQEIDKVLGLKLGADDYVTKPFSVLELIARVKALLKRQGGGEKAAGKLDRFAFRDIEVDFVAMEVRKAGQVIELSAQGIR